MIPEESPQQGSVTPAQVAALRAQNVKLETALRGARELIESLQDEIEQLQQPPNGFGVFVRRALGDKAEISSSGRSLIVGVGSSIDLDELRPGHLVVLNGDQVIIGIYGFGDLGEVVTFKELLDDGLVRVVSRMDEEKVMRLADEVIGRRMRPGDLLLADLANHFVLRVIAKSEVNSLLLEEVPDSGYDDVGGLAKQIEQIRDAVELPLLHPELFRQYGLKPPKGILLYGPPGCGKTLIAKAVANSLAKKAGAEQGNAGARAYFINIKGPELLNKYVGETERRIREVFAAARDKAADGHLVVIFFDEMESMFRARGTGVSSDMESTIVPQVLSEIDGVEGLDNVIVIGASNRQDLIDPALLRPGRLDVKISVSRPEAARDIFGKYLTAGLPLHPVELALSGGSIDRTVERMIEATVALMYAETPANQFLEVTYGNGTTETLYFKDFASGAMIANIVDRAKKSAIKAFLATSGQESGITVAQLIQAVIDEYRGNEDLPNTTNPDDWARIAGKKGERIINIRTVIRREGGGPANGRNVETLPLSTGQYL